MQSRFLTQRGGFLSSLFVLVRIGVMYCAELSYAFFGVCHEFVLSLKKYFIQTFLKDCLKPLPKS